MKHSRMKRLSRLLALPLLLALVIVAIGRAPAATAAHEQMPGHGMICTTSPDSTFVLTTMEGALWMGMWPR